MGEWLGRWKDEGMVGRWVVGGSLTDGRTVEEWKDEWTDR